MKFEPLRWAWVRLFGHGATSVSPPIDIEEQRNAIARIGFENVLNSMIERGLLAPMPPRIEPIPPGPWVDPHQRGAEPEPIGATLIRQMRQMPPSIERPERPGIEPPGWEMPWPEWRRLEAELDAPPGWSACRFPTWQPGDQSAVDAGTCSFVFGIVRGDFGIWRSPFPCCITGDDGMFIEQCEDVLAAVTHLPTGLGMGVFADRGSAIASCNAADGLGIDWRLLNPNDKSGWVRSFSRLRQAREFAGIGICRTRHAHMGNPDGPPLSIWEQRAEAMAEGRPEKLS